VELVFGVTLVLDKTIRTATRRPHQMVNLDGDSDLLRSLGISESMWKRHELMAQADSLRPIVDLIVISLTCALPACKPSGEDTGQV